VSYTVFLLIPLLLLPTVALFGFSGCTGEDPAQIADQAKAEQKTADDAAAAADKKQQDDALAAEQAKQAAEIAAKRYENQVGAHANLVSYWRLGETANTTVAKDSVATAPKDGTYVNLPGITFGQPGALSLGSQPGDTSAEFLGNQGYVEVAPYDKLRNPPYDFTIECWIKPKGVVAKPEVIYGSYELNPPGAGGQRDVVRGVVLDVIPGVAPSTIPQIRLRLGSGGTTPTTLTADLVDTKQFGGWWHVAATYQFNSTTASLYVNAAGGAPAVMQPSTPPASPTPPVTFIENKTAPIRIGAGLDETAPGPGYPAGAFFTGQIDEVALYREALAGSDIEKHFLAAITPV
jgi:hypothetical protein